MLNIIPLVNYSTKHSTNIYKLEINKLPNSLTVFKNLVF